MSCVTYHVSHVTCHMSHDMCHMTCVTWHLILAVLSSSRSIIVDLSVCWYVPFFSCASQTPHSQGLLSQMGIAKYARINLGCYAMPCQIFQHSLKVKMLTCQIGVHFCSVQVLFLDIALSVIPSFNLITLPFSYRKLQSTNKSCTNVSFRALLYNRPQDRCT